VTIPSRLQATGDRGHDPQAHVGAVPGRAPRPGTVGQPRYTALDEPATPGWTTGTPEDAIDCAADLYLGDLTE
jgi:hypothetical protein